MKSKWICAVVLQMAILSVSAQNRAIVITNINHFLQAMAVVEQDPIYELINEKVFPPYLSDSDFNRSVLQNIESSIDSLLPNVVIQSMPVSIAYEHDYFRSKTDTRALSKLRDQDKVYMSIEFKINMAIQVKGQTPYVFSTKIKGFQKGKKVYNLSSEVPFMFVDSESITDTPRLSRDDLFDLIQRGLQDALTSAPKSEKIQLAIAPSQKYDAFLTKSDKLYLQITDSYMRLTQRLEMIDTAMRYSRSLLYGLGSTENVFGDAKYKAGYDVKNRFDDSAYKVQFFGDDSGANDAISIDAVFKRGKDSFGQLTLSNERISGVVDGIRYRTINREKQNIIEFYQNEQLIALIKVFPKYKVSYVQKDLSKEALAPLLNVFLVLEFGIKAAQKLEAAIED